MTKMRQQVGQKGEEAAREYLKEQGYSIVDNNYRCRLGEIDIIARDGNTVVIVEVRTKTGLAFGRPEESITRDKARKLHRLALQYLQSHYQREISSRIDLVAVMVDRNSGQVKDLIHIKNILG
ncbi:MAG: YraN family protein [Bacillota bacterium]